MFAELTDEVPDGTASTPTVLLLEPDQGVHPLSQALPGAEFSKQLSLATEDRVVVASATARSRSALSSK